MPTRVIVPEFISKDIYLLFAIFFYSKISKFIFLPTHEAEIGLTKSTRPFFLF